MTDLWSSLHLLHQRNELYRVNEDLDESFLKPQSFLPEGLDGGAARIVHGVQRLFTATSMGEHCAQMPLLDRHVVWDAPPIFAARKGYLRVAAYVAKFAAHLELQPTLVQVFDLGGGHHTVEVVGLCLLKPHRTWLVPPTLLLPAVVPIHCTIKLGVAGGLEHGKIELIWGRIHNTPVAPTLLRAVVGFALGALPHLLEPVWGLGMELLGDDFYKRRRQGATDEADIDFGNGAADTVQGAATRAYETAADAATRAFESVAGATQGVAGAAQGLAERVGEPLGVASPGEAVSKAKAAAAAVGNRIGLDRPQGAYMDDTPSAAVR